jgi:hypothetical protein
MFTCWMDVEVIGVGLEEGSAKGMEEWTEQETNEVGLDTMIGERSKKLGSRLS